MKEIIKIAHDWAHLEEKQRYVDENGKFRLTLPKPSEEKEVHIYTENIPRPQATALLKKDYRIFRLTDLHVIPGMREDGELPKTDDIDAQLICKLMDEHPEAFREHTGDAPLDIWYSTYKQLQSVKVNLGNKNWALDNDPLLEGIITNLVKEMGTVEKKIKTELKSYSIWTEWLVNVKGVGPSVAGALVSYIGKIGIGNFNTASAMRKYLGVYVDDGKAAGLRKGQKLSYNPKAKSMLLGVFAEQIVMQKTPVYREIYDREKLKLSARVYEIGMLAEKYKGYKKEDIQPRKIHIEKMARRKAVQVFLEHLWCIWRQLEGFSTRPPYVHEKLKHTNMILPPSIPERLQPFEWIK